MIKPGAPSGVFGATGTALSVAFATLPGSTVASVSALLVGLGTALATALGPRINRSARPVPWRMLTASTLLFLCGIIARPWAAQQSGVAALTADLFTLSAYAMMILGLVLLLRVGGGLDRNAFIDGMIVSLGMAAPAVQYLSLPAARIADRPLVISVLAGLYPVIDVLVLFIIVNLAFSTATRLISFRLLTISASMLFVGDLGYAVIGAQGRLVGSALMDLPFLLGFVALGMSALHPSMARFAEIVSQPVQPWSLMRLSLIGPALVAPFVVLSATRTIDRGWFTAVVLSGLLTVALVARAVSAVGRLAETQAEWLHEATHDSLTGLPNRTFLVSSVGARIAGERGHGTFWLIYLDLDDFKLVNDHWGHETGDLLLKEVADRLQGLVARDGTVARLGGDEFVVVGDGDQDRATTMAEGILQILRKPILLPDLELFTTASIGAVCCTEQAGVEAMLRDADVAMYRSKADGRNRWTLFASQMRESVSRRVQTEIDLRAALTQGQLWVAFQPLVSMANATVVGAEALVRWDHPVRGAVPPPEFIGIAEETGLINEIGEWVLLESLRQLADWRGAGLVDDGFSISVNVSARQLVGDRLLETVESALQRLQVPPTCLTLELTESALMVDGTRALEMLEHLRGIGVRLAVDDFGTGYSSLSYLSRLPVYGVKIDRSFVRDLAHNDQDESITRAIVAMSHSLDLVVTAEGIEADEQYRILRDLGVERGQGWLWGKAVSATSFARDHFGWTPARAVGAPRKPSTPVHPGAYS